MKSLTKKQVIQARSGQTFYRVWGVPNIDKSIKYVVQVIRHLGKKKHVDHGKMCGHFINRAVGDRYFKKASQAQKFADEMAKGCYPIAAYLIESYHQRWEEARNRYKLVEENKHYPFYKHHFTNQRDPSSFHRDRPDHPMDPLLVKENLMPE
jgi:hypothetical protein